MKINDGNVARQIDSIAGVTTKYDYNDSGMVVRSETYKGENTASENFESRMQYTFTKSGKVGNLSYEEKGDKVRTYTYTYAADDMPVRSTLPDLSFTNWYYDSLRRNNKIIYSPKASVADKKKLYTILKYQGAEFTVNGKTKKATTGIVNLYTNKFGNGGKAVEEYAYTYDAWGNITGIKELAGNERKYVYNEYGEVIRADETYRDGKTSSYSYTYDNGGNILTETIDDVTHTYVYDSVWKDKLISYGGKQMVYDVFGCPTD